MQNIFHLWQPRGVKIHIPHPVETAEESQIKTDKLIGTLQMRKSKENKKIFADVRENLPPKLLTRMISAIAERKIVWIQ